MSEKHPEQRRAMWLLGLDPERPTEYLEPVDMLIPGRPVSQRSHPSTVWHWPGVGEEYKSDDFDNLVVWVEDE